MIWRGRQQQVHLSPVHRASAQPHASARPRRSYIPHDKTSRKNGKSGNCTKTECAEKELQESELQQRISRGKRASGSTRRGIVQNKSFRNKSFEKRIPAQNEHLALSNNEGAQQKKSGIKTSKGISSGKTASGTTRRGKTCTKRASGIRTSKMRSKTKKHQALPDDETRKKDLLPLAGK